MGVPARSEFLCLPLFHPPEGRRLVRQFWYHVTGPDWRKISVHDKTNLSVMWSLLVAFITNLLARSWNRSKVSQVLRDEGNLFRQREQKIRFLLFRKLFFADFIHVPLLYNESNPLSRGCTLWSPRVRSKWFRFLRDLCCRESFTKRKQRPHPPR